MKPTVFVPLIGRLGNLLFIYAHARAWCEQNGYDLSTYPWVGENVFTIPHAIRPNLRKPDLVWPEAMRQHQRDLIYTRKQVREWFTFKPEIAALLEPARCMTPCLLNVRQAADYVSAGLVTISQDSYIQAAERFGYEGPFCFETDVEPTRLPRFTGNIEASGLGTTAVALPSFFRLMTAPTLFRANSTFSWWAATLGNGTVFSPIIRGLRGGYPREYCGVFVRGNWPVMADCPENSDLHLREE